MQAIKACTDDLAQLGKLMDQEDIISNVIKGLDYDLYKSIIDSVRGRDTLISFEALHKKLIRQALAVKDTTPAPQFPPTAHSAHNPRSTYLSRHIPYTPRHTSSATSTSDPKPFQFNGRCQYCDIVGHVVA
ncbi:hypothetical protein vseg_010650 [Gypsophila vaccaria]